MPCATESLDVLSTGDIARRFGVPTYAVRRVLDRLGIGRMVGRYKAVSAEDAELVGMALKAAGYHPKQIGGATE
jgi:DNA-binding LacI/PurR family transcriptional regulator